MGRHAVNVEENTALFLIYTLMGLSLNYTAEHSRIGFCLPKGFHEKHHRDRRSPLAILLTAAFLEGVGLLCHQGD